MSSLTHSMQLILTLVKTQGQVLKPLESTLSVHGISFTEWLVMHRLYQSSDHTIKRVSLADAIGVTASGVTRLLLPMEKVGWVERVANARDARVSLVRLTPAGLEAYQQATKSIEYAAERVTNMMNQQQVEQCMGLLSSLHLSAIDAAQLS
ncbi:MarR family winged helix-turn-helix transcriptional regulator [Marisediminitalea sp.]|uniref:MarR family winged helix-turn-helix transcriptional regulator n=1 Tax=Marisediminitalea sp. TaxID=2662268 RepID=UPI00243BA847